MSALSFADQIAPDVVTACLNTGVFPSVVIAQAMEESGYGTSTLAQRFKNFFGHKASANWTGKKAQTVKGGSFWRVYDSITDAINAHIRVLKSIKYKIAGAFAAKSPFEQAIALQKAGYNTGPDREQYALKLAQIIKKYNLQQYDQQLIVRERQKNDNNLAYSEQSGITRQLHNIFNS